MRLGLQWAIFPICIFWLCACSKDGSSGDSSALPADDESTAFPLEAQAQQFEQAWIVPHWDRLRRERHAPSAFAPILSHPTLQPLIPPLAQERKMLSDGLVRYSLRPGISTTPKQALARLVRLVPTGVRIQHSDWHQESVRKVEEGFESVVRFNLHAKEGTRRIRWRGSFAVTWPAESPSEPTALRWIDGERLERSGPPAFLAAFQSAANNQRVPTRSTLGGLAVQDLDGDSLPDFAIGNINRRFMNQGAFQFESLPLSDALEEVRQAFDAILFADLTGDRIVDLVGNRNDGQLVFAAGDGKGGFPGAATPLLENGPPLKNIYSISAGDVDGDHDLDLFIGQWISPYEKMPAVYHNALDGPPNLLLRNEGDGRFTDITESSGLSAKAARRTYSASLVDLDQDRDLDLWMVSDFAGPDVFMNDGTGRFTDTTASALPGRGQTATFGMAHAMADYNGDGRVDVFVTGMGSTTARRLEAMSERPGDPMRAPMGYGNRLFLAGQNARFSAAPYSDSVARTGWSWGAVSFDLDNDRDEDLYVANGHISGESTRDYCTHFWCSDIRHGEFLQETAKIKLHLERLGSLDTVSWDGFQANALLVNDSGRGFSERGFLYDLGITHDARCLAAADFDRDGQMDLILTEEGGTSGFEFQPRSGLAPATVYVLQNKGVIGTGNSWIGLQLGIGPKHQPQGARVDVFGREGSRSFHLRKVVVSGDSYKSQNPTEVHFGLGKARSVDRMVVTWPSGEVTNLPNPPINRWHAIGLK